MSPVTERTPLIGKSLPVMPISSDDFRNGMRRLAGGVCILTSEHNGQPAGLTATAVTSLSVDPPRLLACVNKKASAYPVIEQSKTLCVNVLTAEEVSFARRFAGMVPGVAGADRFAEGLWCEPEGGAPALKSALVSFQCRIAETVPASTHVILICDVMGVVLGQADAMPLIYVNGQFTSACTETKNQEGAR
jgi:flavin reductase